MALKNDEQFEEELTCRFKIDIEKFLLVHSKVSKICTLMGCF